VNQEKAEEWKEKGLSRQIATQLTNTRALTSLASTTCLGHSVALARDISPSGWEFRAPVSGIKGTRVSPYVDSMGVGEVLGQAWRKGWRLGNENIQWPAISKETRGFRVRTMSNVAGSSNCCHLRSPKVGPAADDSCRRPTLVA
jgi:hypothetical protein